MFKPIKEGIAFDSAMKDTIVVPNAIFDRVCFATNQGAGSAPITTADLDLVRVRGYINGLNYRNHELFDATLRELLDLQAQKSGNGTYGWAASKTLAVEVVTGYFNLTGTNDNLIIEVSSLGTITTDDTSCTLDIYHYRASKISEEYFKIIGKDLPANAKTAFDKVVEAYIVNDAGFTDTDTMKLYYSDGGTDSFAEKYAFRTAKANGIEKTQDPRIGIVFQDDDYVGADICFETSVAKRIIVVQNQ